MSAAKWLKATELALATIVSEAWLEAAPAIVEAAPAIVEAAIVAATWLEATVLAVS
jgi:hypothetical protein